MSVVKIESVLEEQTTSVVEPGRMIDIDMYFISPDNRNKNMKGGSVYQNLDKKIWNSLTSSKKDD